METFNFQQDGSTIQHKGSSPSTTFSTIQRDGNTDGSPWQHMQQKPEAPHPETIRQEIQQVGAVTLDFSDVLDGGNVWKLGSHLAFLFGLAWAISYAADVDPGLPVVIFLAVYPLALMLCIVRENKEAQENIRFASKYRFEAQHQQITELKRENLQYLNEIRLLKPAAERKDAAETLLKQKAEQFQAAAALLNKKEALLKSAEAKVAELESMLQTEKKSRAGAIRAALEKQRKEIFSETTATE